MWSVSRTLAIKPLTKWPQQKLWPGDGSRMEVPELGSAGNRKELCLVNHRVQTTFRFLRLELLDWEVSF